MDGRVVNCPSCGKANRVPAIESGKVAVCGHCKTPLTGSRAPVVLTDTNFDTTIRQGSFVVDFWAAWCGPCRMIAPVIEQLAAERSDVRFGKLNVDDNRRTAARFGVQGIPLLVFFRDGAEAGRVVGAVPRAQIEAAIERYLT
jgi:thioredoxin